MQLKQEGERRIGVIPEKEILETTKGEAGDRPLGKMEGGKPVNPD